MPEQLAEQPGGITARTAHLFQGFLLRLHAGFKPDGILDVLPQALIDGDEEINGARLVLFGNLLPLLFCPPPGFPSTSRRMAARYFMNWGVNQHLRWNGASS